MTTKPEDTPPEDAPLLTTPADRLDKGCLVLLAAAVLGTAIFPAVLLLGGAPVIVPGVFALLIAMATPLVNPAERMSSGKRWTGRAIVFVTLSSLLLFTAWFFLFRESDGMIAE